MATVLDASILSFFLPAFVFLFIWSVCYAFLSVTKLFGEDAKTLNGTAAFAVAAIAMLSGTKIVNLIAEITPWMVFIIILLFFISVIYLFFGAYGKREASGEAMKEIFGLVGQVPVLVIILIIAVVGISAVFEETVSPYQTVTTESGEVIQINAEGDILEPGEPAKTPASETIQTLVHPRILGAIFMLIVAAVTMQFIVEKVD